MRKFFRLSVQRRNINDLSTAACLPFLIRENQQRGSQFSGMGVLRPSGGANAVAGFWPTSQDQNGQWNSDCVTDSNQRGRPWESGLILEVTGRR